MKEPDPFSLTAEQCEQRARDLLAHAEMISDGCLKTQALSEARHGLNIAEAKKWMESEALKRPAGRKAG